MKQLLIRILVLLLLIPCPGRGEAPSGLISSDAEAKLIVGAGAGAGAGIFPPQAAVRMTAEIKDSILFINRYWMYSWNTMSVTVILVPAGMRPKSKMSCRASASLGLG